MEIRSTTLMNNKRKAIIEYYSNNMALLDDLTNLWHDGIVGHNKELHDYLGLTLEEYGYVMNYDYFTHKDNYIDFIDYLNRACTEI